MTILLSLSARRAWIEIIGLTYDGLIASVALRKESVDRNGFGAKLVHSFLSSLSARRAWIEISYGALAGASEIVALRKESVDRNAALHVLDRKITVALRKESVDRNRATSRQTRNTNCRSPQGERG